MKPIVRTALFGGVAAFVASASPAWASLTDWSVTPLETDIGGMDLHLGGDANGAVFADSQPDLAGFNKPVASGALRFFPKLEIDYDTGVVLALHSSILAVRDPLAIDRYGGTAFEKLYGSLQFGLGTFEVGQVDGPGYRLAIAGPKVDEKVSLDDPEMTFFTNPLTGQAFDRVFTIATEQGPTLNFAKLAYYTPRLFGVQFGTAFTPSEGKGVVPFVSGGPQVPDRQHEFWEFAANYTDYFGQLTFGAYGALTVAHDNEKTAGHKGITDWSFGTEADYDVNDDIKLAIGGAYRQSDAYAFEVNNALGAGSTRALHGSATLTYQSWIAGAELIDGTAEGSLGAPTLGVHGYGASLGYVISSNLQLTGGWQKLRYAQSAGAFYNGLPAISMDAAYLHLDFHV